VAGLLTEPRDCPMRVMAGLLTEPPTVHLHTFPLCHLLAVGRRRASPDKQSREIRQPPSGAITGEKHLNSCGNRYIPNCRDNCPHRFARSGKIVKATRIFSPSRAAGPSWRHWHRAKGRHPHHQSKFEHASSGVGGAAAYRKLTNRRKH